MDDDDDNDDDNDGGAIDGDERDKIAVILIKNYSFSRDVRRAMISMILCM